MFVIPEEPEDDKKQVKTKGVLSEIVDAADKTGLKKDQLESKEEKLNRRFFNPVNETKISEAGVEVETLKGDPADVTKVSTSNARENRDVSEMKKRKSSEDVSATQIEEELNKESKRIKSFGQSLESRNADKTACHKSGELPALNGVYEDVSSDVTPAKILNDTKPELVTVREGYSLAAPKQKVLSSMKNHDDRRLNGTVSNSETPEQQENRAKQNIKNDGRVSGVSPLETETNEKSAQVLQSKSAAVVSTTSASKADDSARKLQTPAHLSPILITLDQSKDEKEPTLNSSNIPQENEKGKAGRDFAGEIIQPVRNKTPSENGGKTFIAGQSESGKQLRDNSLKVLNLPQNGDLGSSSRSEEKRNDERCERSGEKEGNRQTGFKDKHHRGVFLSVSVGQDNSLNVGVDETPEPLNEPNGSKREGLSREGSDKRRRLSEADLNLRPLSPVMEDGESDNQLLNPSAGRTAKVKKSKSFVARGFSKMFGSKRKHKVDKGAKENSFSSECESQRTQAEFDRNENRGETKENTKKKKKKVEGKHGDEKISDGQSTNESKSKHSSRKFGGLFSPGKKKEKHSHSNESK